MKEPRPLKEILDDIVKELEILDDSWDNLFVVMVTKELIEKIKKEKMQ